MTWNAVAWLFEVYEILKDHADSRDGDTGGGLDPGRCGAAVPASDAPGALPERLAE